ncbi:MAG: type I-E CRISPR-associated protein Cas5/CasD, partial [Psychrobacter celer]
MDYLVMRLYAPISSWGTLAVGEDRPTVNYPTRSAVLGLLGAALGIKRSEAQKLRDLASSIGIASKTYSEGTILRDYHTIQTPTTSKGVNFFTRKQELQSAKVETILSSRDYRED